MNFFALSFLALLALASAEDLVSKTTIDGPSGVITKEESVVGENVVLEKSIPIVNEEVPVVEAKTVVHEEVPVVAAKSIVPVTTAEVPLVKTALVDGYQTLVGSRLAYPYLKIASTAEVPLVRSVYEAYQRPVYSPYFYNYPLIW